MALAAIEAGKHTLVEIPIAMNLEGAEQVVAAAAERGLTLGVVHPMRFRQERLPIIERIRRGEERVSHVQGRFFIHRLQNVGATGLQRSWTDNLLWHHTTHLVDFGLWMLSGGDLATADDRIRRVYSVYPPLDQRTGIPMELVLVIKTHDDQTIVTTGSYYSREYVYDTFVVTDRDSYRIDERRATLSTGDGEQRDRHRAGERRAHRAGLRRGRRRGPRAARPRLVGAARHAGAAPGAGGVGRPARQADAARPSGHLTPHTLRITGGAMTAGTELDPLPDGVLDKLRQVSTSTLATQLYKRGFRQPQLLGVRPLSQVADGFVAEAFTMRFIPAREDVDALDPYRSGNTLQWEAIEGVPPGQVIVVDSRGDTAAAASGGDMLMTRAWKRGAAGVRHRRRAA